MNGLRLPYRGGIPSDVRRRLCVCRMSMWKLRRRSFLNLCRGNMLNLCRRKMLNLCRRSMLGLHRFDIHKNGVLVPVVRTYAGRQDPMAQTAIVFLHAPPW